MGVRCGLRETNQQAGQLELGLQLLTSFATMACPRHDPLQRDLLAESDHISVQ